MKKPLKTQINTIFCDYLTTHAGSCGLPATDGTRCKKHKGLQQKKIREKTGPFSGGSQYREEQGQFQAIKGR